MPTKDEAPQAHIGVMLGKFLGFVVRHRGIELNQAKVREIQDMRAPRNLKELRGF